MYLKYLIVQCTVFIPYIFLASQCNLTPLTIPVLIFFSFLFHDFISWLSSYLLSSYSPSYTTPPIPAPSPSLNLKSLMSSRKFQPNTWLLLPFMSPWLLNVNLSHRQFPWQFFRNLTWAHHLIGLKTQHSQTEQTIPSSPNCSTPGAVLVSLISVEKYHQPQVLQHRPLGVIVDISLSVSSEGMKSWQLFLLITSGHGYFITCIQIQAKLGSSLAWTIAIASWLISKQMNTLLPIPQWFVFYTEVPSISIRTQSLASSWVAIFSPFSRNCSMSSLKGSERRLKVEQLYPTWLSGR